MHDIVVATPAAGFLWAGAAAIFMEERLSELRRTFACRCVGGGASG
jgi:hypothetical protein